MPFNITLSLGFSSFEGFASWKAHYAFPFQLPSEHNFDPTRDGTWFWGLALLLCTHSDCFDVGETI